jgi:hypothetical protein
MSLALDRLVNLAAAHGHGWANWYLDYLEGPLDAGIAPTIHTDCANHPALAEACGCACAAWTSSLDSELAAIDAGFRLWERDSPFVIIRGIGPARTHITGSGRVRWSVTDDGTTSVEVWRPATIRRPEEHCVLRATVDPSGRVEFDELDRYSHRHRNALVLPVPYDGPWPETLLVDDEQLYWFDVCGDLPAQSTPEAEDWLDGRDVA